MDTLDQKVGMEFIEEGEDALLIVRERRALSFFCSGYGRVQRLSSVSTLSATLSGKAAKKLMPVARSNSRTERWCLSITSSLVAP